MAPKNRSQKPQNHASRSVNDVYQASIWQLYDSWYNWPGWLAIHEDNFTATSYEINFTIKSIANMSKKVSRAILEPIRPLPIITIAVGWVLRTRLAYVHGTKLDLCKQWNLVFYMQNFLKNWLWKFQQNPAAATYLNLTLKKNKLHHCDGQINKPPYPSWLGSIFTK